MHTDTKHVVFSGGGTGGHLFPGLAVAQQLRSREPGWHISFCGNGQRFERTHVHRERFAYQGLPCRPLPQQLRGAWQFVRDHVRGVRLAGKLIHDENVSLVVGLGGYASVPMARAALRGGVPLVLLEQNAAAGRATRWLAPGAAVVCLAFDESRSSLRPNVLVRVVGNPVRAEFLATPAHAGKSHRRRLVVLGGSQGSADLNEHVPRAIYKIHHLFSGWQVVHIAGHEAVEATQSLYCKLSVSAEVLPFVADMPGLLAGASLAISRAGGTTLAELAAMGVPAALVPLPHAIGNHQRLNANHFADAGAAVTVDSRDLPGRLDDNLSATLLPLLSNPYTLDQMARRMLALARPNATSDVVELIRQFLGRQRHASAA